MLRIQGDIAIAQTVDFFTPIVDDPFTFGAIAAANSVSDIYAMGATPILGLAIAAFPTDVLPLDVLQEILRGGSEKAAEAGFPIAGGHTIIDDVPKYGLAVTGVVSVANVEPQKRPICACWSAVNVNAVAKSGTEPATRPLS